MIKVTTKNKRRRKYVEADTASKDEDGYAKKGIACCDKLFYIEEQLKELTAIQSSQWTQFVI